MSVEKYEKDEQIKFRHFVPSRWLHPLAPLKRLSPVDLPSANGFDKPFAACGLAVRHMAITHISHENREKELKSDGTISSESRSFVD